ncbi:4'-phosphopantetheinyl transferase psf-1 [Luteitalea pratensis]|uniref:4'-phosphopantetheinyl transferase psf-1 n=1 Tax=Luteitalea pratensis TaxID=1855912 RepID=A0A143PX17_LUTPR|nr:4'-phosphopantetheinyl transferase superfamily protein [Luteitalea pratensis]AMY12374.1 4'-phosphopantetheinyl transferase psf-1 [Luteitalea pratensis]
MRALPPLIDVTFVRGVDGEPPWTGHVLDAGELARWTGLHTTARPLFLAAHLGARLLAARRAGLQADGLGLAPELTAFGWATLPSGKPLLTFRDGRPQPLHVSVAHGGGLAVAAVCEHGPIGVDLEHVDTRRNLVGIARRFFAAEECAELEACGSDERSLLFHQWWTRKEAVLKATGHGLRGGLTVRVDAPADRDGWRPVALEGHEAPLFVRDLRTPDTGVVGAVAIEGQAGVVQMVMTTAAEEST